MLAASYYWNDPTMDTSATRGGQPGNPFNTGPLRFYNDQTLQFQAPRMGNLYGTGVSGSLRYEIGMFLITVGGLGAMLWAMKRRG
jgi:hypothetical protein